MSREVSKKTITTRVQSQVRILGTHRRQDQILKLAKVLPPSLLGEHRVWSETKSAPLVIQKKLAMPTCVVKEMLVHTVFRVSSSDEGKWRIKLRLC